MTNADKYLKDGVDVEEFIRDLYNYSVEYCDKYGCASIMHIDQVIVKNFFEQSVKPKLTEDEKVILRHINTINIDRIGRHDCGDLILLSKGGGFYLMTTHFNFDGLFQFIKPRRRI